MTVPRAVPQPEEARGPADLLALMARLRQWSGLPLSEIDERLRAAGVAVPGGVAGMLGGGTLPSRVLLSAFVTTCGLVPDERDRWLRVHDRLGSPSGPMPPAPIMPIMPTVPPDGDRRVAGPPASNTRSEPLPEKAADQPRETASGRHARSSSAAAARHRRTSRRGPAAHRRASLLVAAPAIITIGLVASTLPDLLGGDGGHGRTAAPSGTTSVQANPKPASAAPSPGWYTFVPMTDDERSGNCLSVLPDDTLKPQLAQDKCASDDNLQRIKIVSLEGAAGTFRLQAWTPDSKLWCTTLDSRADRSALHMSRCSDDPLQRFGVAHSAKKVKAGRVYDIVPEATRAEGMCVGIDLRETGGLQALHTPCDRTGIRGYLLTPVAEPPESS